MKDIITIIILGSVFGLLLLIIIKSDILKRRAISAMPDDEPAMDEVQEEDYNGKELFIREEERDIWDKMTRKQKRWVINEQNKKVKSGKYFRTLDGKLITTADAKKHGLI